MGFLTTMFSPSREIQYDAVGRVIARGVDVTDMVPAREGGHEQIVQLILALPGALRGAPISSLRHARASRPRRAAQPCAREWALAVLMRAMVPGLPPRLFFH